MRCTWDTGLKVIKCIGFDVTEDHRTYSDGGNLQVCPADGLPTFGDRYRCRYPLREWGIDRAECGRIITRAGLPLPPKSACFFCPAMRDVEIRLLAREHPDLHRLALEMERLYRSGPHFRGDATYTLTARHRITGERLRLVVTGHCAADARRQFRTTHDDAVRPYAWKLDVSRAVVGLGRNKTWKDVSAV